MKRFVSASAGLVWLLMGLTGLAAMPQSITDRNAPLVRELEMRFASSLAAARTGDVDTYWSYRTAASRRRPPALDSARLKLLADLLPPLDSLQFVRLDATAKMARALYRWRREDAAQYTVIVYRIEQGEWKVDDFNVRRSGMAPPARQSLSEATTAQHGNGTTVPAPSLEAPRL